MRLAMRVRTILRCLPEGTWFRLVPTGVEGVVHRQLPNETIVRFIGRGDRVIQPRQSWPMNASVETLDKPPAYLNRPLHRRRWVRDPDADPPSMRILAAAPGPEVEKLLRKCGWCGGDEVLAFYERGSWRCQKCGRPTMPLDADKVDADDAVWCAARRAIGFLDRDRPDIERAIAQLRSIQRDILTRHPAHIRKLDERQRERRRRSSWRRRVSRETELAVRLTSSAVGGGS
jgi:ribosomal protein S27AE